MPEPITDWIDDLSRHRQAAERLAALGKAAIPILGDYLARPPQPIPHARCFAVAMLARLPADEATQALRRVLPCHPLKTLGPPFGESEYVVKSAALEALLRRCYPQLADDVALGVAERLRVAVAAVGTQGLAPLAATLVELLDDDVLAEAASSSLVALAPCAFAAITVRLDAWFEAAATSARERMALIRALLVLQRTGASLGGASLRRALADAHPAVAAAAALCAWQQRSDGTLIEALLHGAAGFVPALVEPCRNALAAAGPERVGALQRTLDRDAEPDLYGDVHPLSGDSRAWLVAELRRRSGGCQGRS